MSAVVRSFVMSAVFAIIAVAYLVSGSHLSHWASVAALAGISLLWLGQALDAWVVDGYRQLAERRRTR